MLCAASLQRFLSRKSPDLTPSTVIVLPGAPGPFSELLDVEDILVVGIDDVHLDRPVIGRSLIMMVSLKVGIDQGVSRHI